MTVRKFLAALGLILVSAITVHAGLMQGSLMCSYDADDDDVFIDYNNAGLFGCVTPGECTTTVKIINYPAEYQWLGLHFFVVVTASQCQPTGSAGLCNRCVNGQCFRVKSCANGNAAVQTLLYQNDRRISDDTQLVRDSTSGSDTRIGDGDECVADPACCDLVNNGTLMLVGGRCGSKCSNECSSK